MASSTSSSSVQARLSTRPWGRIYLKVVLVLVLTLFTWEMSWRAQGFKPRLNDDYGLWATVRKRLVGKGRDAVALIGASRIKQAVHLPTLREEQVGAGVAQLSLSGAHPLPALRHLAKDISFRGKVMVDVTPWIFFAQGTGSHQGVESWVRRFEESLDGSTISEPFFLEWERWGKQFLQQHFVSAGWDITPEGVMRELMAGTWPEPNFYWSNADRTQLMDYTHVDVPKFRASRGRLTEEAKALGPHEVERLIAETAELVGQIQARGGQVVFLRTPTTGRVREAEKKTFPRDRYWDALVNSVGAVAIHFEDHPSLRHYTCTDDSHVDVEETPRYTRALARILKSQLAQR